MNMRIQEPDQRTGRKLEKERGIAADPGNTRGTPEGLKFPEHHGPAEVQTLAIKDHLRVSMTRKLSRSKSHPSTSWRTFRGY